MLPINNLTCFIAGMLTMALISIIIYNLED